MVPAPGHRRHCTFRNLASLDKRDRISDICLFAPVFLCTNGGRCCLSLLMLSLKYPQAPALSGVYLSMNPCYLRSSYPFPVTLLGNIGNLTAFLNWQGNCVCCGKVRTMMSGVFCANFSHARDCCAPCNQVWCGPCYSAHPLDRFPRYTPADEDGFEWHTLKDALRYIHARDGDHLLTPFQCDLCVFRNLKGRNPVPDSNLDHALLCCICRVNLDAVWGREPSTVANSLRGAVQLVQQWAKVGLEPTFPALGPYPVDDTFGFSVAIGMVLKSMEPGRYDSYQQYETIRKLRAAYSNLYMASKKGSASLRSFGRDRVKHYLTDSPTQSLFFERFSQGCVHRMGQEVRQHWAITLPAMHALLEVLEVEWEQGLNLELTAIVRAYAVIAFAGSFHGNEVFLAPMHGVRKYLRSTEPPEDAVIIALLGRFKGETGERYHLAPLAAQTSSGILI
jgi:hypothetical protein